MIITIPTRKNEAWKLHPVHRQVLVSNQGRVYTLEKGILFQSYRGNGYKAVRIPTRDGSKCYYVHHLVLQAFVCPRPTGMICRHGRRGKTCNHLGNIRWGTHRDNNVRDKIRDGTIWPKRLHDRELRRLRKMLKNGATQIAMAELFGVTQSNVSRIWRDEVWAGIQ